MTDDVDFGRDFVDSNIGAVLEGRYLLVRTIGSGGMGTVYEAQHQLVGSRLAIKILHKHLMDKPEIVRRFMNEARAAGSLGHPNIVRSTDVGKTPEGIPFVVFEHLDGVTLKEEIVDGGPLAIDRALSIGVQIASGLEAAHKSKIIHRDVKPENIILVRDVGNRELVKIVDFGIAKFDAIGTTLTSKGNVFGSPQYMSPEQMKDAGKVNVQTDVYSLGVLLYEMLTAKPPYDANDLATMIARIAARGIRPLRALRPEVPEAVAAVVHKALAVNPAERHGSMAALRRDLEGLQGAWQAGELATSDEVTDALPVHPRRRWWALVAAACVVGALVVTYVKYDRRPAAPGQSSLEPASREPGASREPARDVLANPASAVPPEAEALRAEGPTAEPEARPTAMPEGPTRDGAVADPDGAARPRPRPRRAPRPARDGDPNDRITNPGGPPMFATPPE